MYACTAAISLVPTLCVTTCTFHKKDGDFRVDGDDDDDDDDDDEMLVGDDDDVDVVDRGHKWESSFHPLLVTKFT